MDADWIESQRDRFLSRREKRWSMNSQRLEQIVAELMKPITTDHRTFVDTDLSALLEEYLTEAGLHALDADEDAGTAEFVMPNFVEIALLLQQSVSIYCRKVDFLYLHVLNVSDSLQNSTQEVTEEEAGSAAEPSTPSSGRRNRKASANLLAGFEEIKLGRDVASNCESEAPQPPPTLPRMSLELEPRLVTPADVPLLDYTGENIGLITDFQVTWRLHDGMLVDELEGGSACAHRPLRPISLVELQAAIEAAAPASPPLLHDDSPLRDLSPLHASTPLPPDDPAPVMPPPAKRERKRRSADKIDDIFDGSAKIVISKELMRQLKEVREFSISAQWIASVVAKRKNHILSERKRLLHEEGSPADEDEPDGRGGAGGGRAVSPGADAEPRGGFAGWSSAAAAEALAGVQRARAEPDSDDDGFFEQSSGGLEPEAAGSAAAWRAGVLQRAEAAAARGALDVRALGRRVLRALGAGGAEQTPRHVDALLRDEAREPSDVARVLLASLFLANAGNVEIVSGPPLTMNSFSLRLVSRDLRRMVAPGDPFLR